MFESCPSPADCLTTRSTLRAIFSKSFEKEFLVMLSLLAGFNAQEIIVQGNQKKKLNLTRDEILHYAETYIRERHPFLVPAMLDYETPLRFISIHRNFLLYGRGEIPKKKSAPTNIFGKTPTWLNKL